MWSVGILLAVAWAQSPEPVPDSALQLLEQGRTTFNPSTLDAARDTFARLTEVHPNNALYWYERARANHYRSLALEAHGDKKNAGKALDEAVSEVQQSLELSEGSSDAHSLLADLYGRKIGYGMPMFTGPKYGPKVQQENQRALELDANNPRAYASLGRQYFMAPKMFGGDLEKAIGSFHKSTQLDPKSDETFVWLAIALRKKGDNAGAQQALQEALRLNPQSAFAKETEEKK
jgi:tetratricopeptide (TPR) repeat protein